MFDYIDIYGDLTFDEKKPTEVDSLIFSQVSYLDLRGSEKSMTIEETSEFINKKTFKNLGIAQTSMLRLLDVMSKTKRYKDIVLSNYEYILTDKIQFGAVCITLPNGIEYISFEGTDDNLAGWKEDFMLAYLYPTGAQTLASEYINKHAKLFGPKVTIVGHSKGGNLALVGSMNSNFIKKYKIEKIYSFDGPGLKESEFTSKKYLSICDRLVNVIPNKSLVGVFLKQENLYVIKSTGVGIMQHDATTWQVENDHFVRTTQDKLSKDLDESINKWLIKYNYEERKQIVDVIFSLLEETGMKTVSDLKTNKIKSLNTIIKNSLSISPETRKVVFNSLRLLISEIGAAFLDDKTSYIKSKLPKLKK